jgi:hypothetical protein
VLAEYQKQEEEQMVEEKPKGRKGKQAAKEEPAKSATSGALGKRNAKGKNGKVQLTEEDERKLRAKNSEKFARNVSGNFRFDPLALGLGVMGAKGDSEEPEIQRCLTNLDLVIEDINDVLRLEDMFNDFMNELKFGPAVTEKTSILKLGIVPSKKEMESSLKKLGDSKDKLSSSSSLSDHEKAVIESGIELWTLLFKFLNTMDPEKLYSIKEELIATKGDSVKKPTLALVEKIAFDLRVILFLLNTLQPRMDAFMMMSLQQLKCGLARTIIRYGGEGTSKRYLSLFSTCYEQLMDALNLNDEGADLLNSINFDLVMRCVLDTDYRKGILATQTDPFVNIFIGMFEKKQIRITAKFWGSLMQTITNYMQFNHLDYVVLGIEKIDRLSKWIKTCLKIPGATLEKAFYLGAVKVALTGPLVDEVCERRSVNDIDSFFLDILSNEDTLPFFVCFYQALAIRLPNMLDIKDLKYPNLTKFLLTYMFKSQSEKIQDIKVKLPLGRCLDEAAATMNEYLQTGKAEACIDDIVRSLIKPDKLEFEKERDIERQANQNKYYGYGQADPTKMEALPNPLESFVTWVTLLNEVYLVHIMKEVPENLKIIKKAVEKKDKDLKSKLPESSYKFLKQLASNFEGVPIMSLNPGMDDAEIRVRINMVMFMAQFMLTKSQDNIFSRTDGDKNPLYKRDQLCAYPCEEEEKFRIIAQMVYEKEARGIWGASAYDVTSLNQCTCGYYYFIGNCGMPMQTSYCPECKRVIGGKEHAYVTEKPQNVSNKQFLTMYGKLEKIGARIYKVRDLNKIDDSISVRFIKGATNFKLIEFMVHSRYLLELAVGTTEEVTGLKKLLTIKDTEIPHYLLELIKIDFKAAQFELKSEIRAFHWMNCIASGLAIDQNLLSGDSSSKRNLLEKELSNKIDYFVLNSDKIVKAVRKNKDSDLADGRIKRLINGWIANTVTADEFKNCFPKMDLRLITGLRPNMVDLSKIDKIGQLTKLLQSMGETPADKEDSCALIKFMLTGEEYLTKFQQLFFGILELSNFLLKHMDSNISWKAGCGLSIADLTRKAGQTQLLDEDNEDIIQSFQSKPELQEELSNCYTNFVKSWQDLMKIRERFPAVFDFRFMCHGDIVNEKMITELENPAEAKVAYFLVCPGAVESLMINSILMTMSKINNDMLDKFSSQFLKVNGNKPVKIMTQNMTLEDPVGLTCSFDDLICRCVRLQPGSTQLEFNLELLERMLAEEMFLGKPTLEFLDGSMVSFNPQLDFNFCAAVIQDLSARRRITQIPLNSQQIGFLETIGDLKPLRIFGQLQKSLKKAAQKGGLNPGELLRFEDDKEGLSQMRLTAEQVQAFYLLLEAEPDLFRRATRHLDVLFLAELEQAQKSALQANKILKSTTGTLLATGVRRLLLRQAVGGNGEKLSKEILSPLLEYSDVFEEPGQQDVEADEIVAALPDGITVGQALNLLSTLENIVPKSQAFKLTSK